MRIMTHAIGTLTERCIKGITANEDHCRKLVTHSIGLVTALNPVIGYENATRIAQRAQATVVALPTSCWWRACSARPNSTTCCGRKT
jgi:aspartate ammonia-lyase